MAIIFHALQEEIFYREFDLGTYSTDERVQGSFWKLRLPFTKTRSVPNLPQQTSDIAELAGKNPADITKQLIDLNKLRLTVGKELFGRSLPRLTSADPLNLIMRNPNMLRGYFREQLTEVLRQRFPGQNPDTAFANIVTADVELARQIILEANGKSLVRFADETSKQYLLDSKPIIDTEVIKARKDKLMQKPTPAETGELRNISTKTGTELTAAQAKSSELITALKKTETELQAAQLAAEKAKRHFDTAKARIDPALQRLVETVGDLKNRISPLAPDLKAQERIALQQTNADISKNIAEMEKQIKEYNDQLTKLETEQVDADDDWKQKQQNYDGEHTAEKTLALETAKNDLTAKESTDKKAREDLSSAENPKNTPEAQKKIKAYDTWIKMAGEGYVKVIGTRFEKSILQPENEFSIPNLSNRGYDQVRKHLFYVIDKLNFDPALAKDMVPDNVIKEAIARRFNLRDLGINPVELSDREALDYLRNANEFQVGDMLRSIIYLGLTNAEAGNPCLDVGNFPSEGGPTLRPPEGPRTPPPAENLEALQNRVSALEREISQIKATMATKNDLNSMEKRIANLIKGKGGGQPPDSGTPSITPGPTPAEAPAPTIPETPLAMAAFGVAEDSATPSLITGPGNGPGPGGAGPGAGPGPGAGGEGGPSGSGGPAGEPFVLPTTEALESTVQKEKTLEEMTLEELQEYEDKMLASSGLPVEDQKALSAQAAKMTEEQLLRMNPLESEGIRMNSGRLTIMNIENMQKILEEKNKATVTAAAPTSPTGSGQPVVLPPAATVPVSVVPPVVPGGEPKPAGEVAPEGLKDPKKQYEDYLASLKYTDEKGESDFDPHKLRKENGEYVIDPKTGKPFEFKYFADANIFLKNESEKINGKPTGKVAYQQETPSTAHPTTMESNFEEQAEQEKLNETIESIREETLSDPEGQARVFGEATRLTEEEIDNMTLGERRRFLSEGENSLSHNRLYVGKLEEAFRTYNADREKLFESDDEPFEAVVPVKTEAPAEEGANKNTPEAIKEKDDREYLKSLGYDIKIEKRMGSPVILLRDKTKKIFLGNEGRFMANTNNIIIGKAFGFPTFSEALKYLGEKQDFEKFSEPLHVSFRIVKGINNSKLIMLRDEKGKDLNIDPFSKQAGGFFSFADATEFLEKQAEQEANKASEAAVSTQATQPGRKVMLQQGTSGEEELTEVQKAEKALEDAQKVAYKAYAAYDKLLNDDKSFNSAARDSYKAYDVYTKAFGTSGRTTIEAFRAASPEGKRLYDEFQRLAGVRNKAEEALKQAKAKAAASAPAPAPASAAASPAGTGELGLEEQLLALLKGLPSEKNKLLETPAPTEQKPLSPEEQRLKDLENLGIFGEPPTEPNQGNNPNKP